MDVKPEQRKVEPSKMKIYKSLFAGEIAKDKTQFPTCWCVGDLKRALQSLPDELPLDCEGIRPVWVNIGHDEPYMPEHLNLEGGHDFEDDEDEE